MTSFEARLRSPVMRVLLLVAYYVLVQLAVLAVSPVSMHHAMMLPDWGETTLLLNGAFEPDAEQAAALSRRGVTVGRTPVPHVTNGGLDGNWLTARGLPTVTLGCGQENVHTVNEALDIEEFQDACRIGLCLATQSA